MESVIDFLKIKLESLSSIGSKSGKKYISTDLFYSF